MSSLDALFSPRSIAVVGASRRPRSVGYEVVANLLRGGFVGPVYPVNPTARAVHSVPAYPSLADVPGEVDLAVITVPQDRVPEVIEDAVKAGVNAILTITAGFREVSEDGAALERRILETLRASGVRMVGPNCLGVINNDPEVRMNASFAASTSAPGNVAVASQSGALGEAILQKAAELGLGLSAFVSLGNKTDVSGNDLLEHWTDDPNTQVVLLYLESFGNPRRFATLARRMTREQGKPIIAVKSGRSRRGAQAASSHTGSLAGADTAVDSLLHQCGVIRVDTVAQLFGVAQGFANQPVPRGGNIGIVTNAGGPGVMATDAAIHRGLELAELTPVTRARLREVLAPEASVLNPVDAIATAGREQYRASMEAMLTDPNVDAVIVIFVSPVMIDAEDVARGIVEGVEAARKTDPAARGKPVLSCFMGKHQGAEGIVVLREAKIPAFPFPEAAAESLAAMTRFGKLRAQPLGERLRLVGEAGVRAASAIFSTARRRLGAAGGWMRFDEVMGVLEAYGIPVAPWRVVEGADAAVDFAEERGYPVVLKVDSETVLHKSEHGLVRLDLQREQDVRGAFAEIRANLEGLPGAHRFVVQRMVRGDAETLMGATTDPTFGHLLAFGLGGVFAEVMEDVVFRVHPVTDVEAADMIRSIRGYPILSGARGGAHVDQEALRDVLIRLDQLVGDHPEIAEMDLNPFLASAQAARQAAVDARARIVPGQKSPPDEEDGS